MGLFDLKNREWSKNGNFESRSSWKTFCGPIRSKKTQDKKMNFFTKTMDLPLSKNKSFATFEIRYF